MKTTICILLSFFLLALASEASAQMPPEMRAKYSDEEYALIMSRYHFHFRYELHGPVDKPVQYGQVKLGHEYYERWQGPNGWYYCAKDGECFDRRGLGVDPSGSCWVDAQGNCTDNEKKRDVSMFAKHFRVRGDLGPPMKLTGEIPDAKSASSSLFVSRGSIPVLLETAFWSGLLHRVSPLGCFARIHF